MAHRKQYTAIKVRMNTTDNPNVRTLGPAAAGGRQCLHEGTPRLTAVRADDGRSWVLIDRAGELLDRTFGSLREIREKFSDEDLQRAIGMIDTRDDYRVVSPPSMVVDVPAPGRRPRAVISPGSATRYDRAAAERVQEQLTLDTGHPFVIMADGIGERFVVVYAGGMS